MVNCNYNQLFSSYISVISKVLVNDISPPYFSSCIFSLFVKIRNRRRAIKREVFDASMQILKYKNGHKISSSIFSSTHHYVKSSVWWDDFDENGSLFVLMRQKNILWVDIQFIFTNKNATMNLIFIGDKITRKSHPTTIIFFPFCNLKCHFRLHIFLSILCKLLLPWCQKLSGTMVYFLKCIFYGWLTPTTFICIFGIYCGYIKNKGVFRNILLVS